jgi:hypothetical protein
LTERNKELRFCLFLPPFLKGPHHMDSLGATNGAVDIVPGLTRTVGRVRIEALLVLIPNVLALKGAEQWVLCNEKTT